MFLNAASALAWLRWRMFVHRSFRGFGPLNLIGTILIGFSVTVLALAIGLGFAIGFITSVQGHNTEMLGLVFTLAFGFIFGSVLFLPFLHAAAEQGFDARRCLIFPVPLSQLYAILMLSELGGAHYVFAYPTLLAVLAAGIWVAHGAFLPAMGVVLLFAVMTAVWSNLLMLGLQRLLQKRRLREAVILATAFILLSIGILPQVVIQRTQRIKAPGSISSAGGFLKAASGALPPVWASNAMMALQAGNWKGVPAPAAGLLLMTLAGIGMGVAVFKRVVLDVADGASKASRPSAAPPRRMEGDRVGTFTASLARRIPPETRAVWIKDLHCIIRSGAGRLSLLMVPLLTLFLVKAFTSVKLPAVAAYGAADYLFLFFSIYISMFGLNMSNNIFRWEGAGMKSYFLMPAPGRRVLMGKNLANATFAELLFGLFMATFAVIHPLPRFGVVFTAFFCFTIALVVFAAAGNILSIFFPKKQDITSWKGSAPSTSAGLVGMLILMLVMVLLAPALLLPSYFKVAWLTALILPILLVLAMTAYSYSLNPAARFLENRREDLIQTLRSAD